MRRGEKIKKYTDKQGFRFTEEQMRHMIKKSEECNITTSEYIRRLVDADRSGKEASFLDKETFFLLRSYQTELGRIGTNINQIVKNVNIHLYSVSEKKQLFILMNHIRNIFQDIAKNS